MNLTVAGKTGSLLESLRTQWTLVMFLLRMYHLMFLQGGLCLDALTAQLAHKRLLISMRLHMTSQPSTLLKHLGANGALEGLLIGVNCLVVSQVYAVREGSPTFFAKVLLVIIMMLHMMSQPSPLLEHFGAHEALEVLLVGVNRLVVLQGFVVHKGSPAFFARVWSLISMRPHMTRQSCPLLEHLGAHGALEVL